MKIERFSVNTCCKGTSVALKLGSPLSKDFLPSIESGGFKENPQFTKVGIFYVENASLIATGALGSDILQIRCKSEKENCENYINIFQELLSNMG